MDHPGPPQFAAVGDVVQLAPRDPVLEATYRWAITGAPSASEATVGGEAVEEFVPDIPGHYTVTLDTPVESHDLTIRVFPGDHRPTGEGAGTAGVAGQSGYSGRSGRSGYSGKSGSARKSGGESGFASGSGSGARADPTEDEDGRPRVRIDAEIEGGEAVVRATPTPHPDSSRDAANLDVEFLLDDRDDVTREDVTVDDRELRVPIAGSTSGSASTESPSARAIASPTRSASTAR